MFKNKLQLIFKANKPAKVENNIFIYLSIQFLLLSYTGSPINKYSSNNFYKNVNFLLNQKYQDFIFLHNNVNRYH